MELKNNRSLPEAKWQSPITEGVIPSEISGSAGGLELF